MKECNWPDFCRCKDCKKWSWLPLIQGESPKQKLKRQLRERNVPTRGIFGC